MVSKLRLRCPLLLTFFIPRVTRRKKILLSPIDQSPFFTILGLKTLAKYGTDFEVTPDAR